MSDGKPETCCVCGRALPNRYAVAGRCEADGCAAAFCAWHWHNGNRLCPDHGWSGTGRGDPTTPQNDNGKESTSMVIEGNDGKALCAQADANLPAAKKASLLKQIGEFAVKLGTGAGALAKRLAGIKSTDEAMREIEAQIDENRARCEPASKRYEELYSLIVAKKKAYQAAPPARKKILEMELKSAIAEYQSLERQIAAYLKNETILAKVKGRMCELVAMSLKSVSEAQIDKLTDRVEDAADSEEDLDGAIGELDKAGVRREREDGAFEDALAAFGDELPEELPPETAERLGEKPADIRLPTADTI